MRASYSFFSLLLNKKEPINPIPETAIVAQPNGPATAAPIKDAIPAEIPKPPTTIVDPQLHIFFPSIMLFILRALFDVIDNVNFSSLAISLETSLRLFST